MFITTIPLSCRARRTSAHSAEGMRQHTRWLFAAEPGIQDFVGLGLPNDCRGF